MKNWIKSLAVALLFTAAPAQAFKVGGMTWVTTDGTANQVMKTDGAGNLGWKSVLAPTDITATAPLTYNSGTGVIAIPLATNLASGYLAFGDWINFNNRITGLTGDVTATGPTGGTGPSNVAATVAIVGGSSAANVHAAELLANAATSANTASTIVKRGSSGEFTAGAITASFLGALNGTVGATTPAAGTFTTGVFGTSLASTGDFAVATNKFTVAASSGNTVIAGTGSVTGDFAVATNKFTVAASSGNTVIAGTGSVTGDFAVATNKFTVAASSGNTVVAGTLGVTGVATFTAQPIMSSLTASQAVFTDSSKGLVSNAITGTGNVVMSAGPTLTGTIGAAAMTLSSTLLVSGVATFTLAPVLSSTTASQALFTDGSKNVVSNAITGTGNVVMSASPTLTGTIGAANATFSGTTLHTGVATFTAAPVFSSGTASQAMFLDGSKNLVTNAITGTGNVVMSTSATLVTPALGTPSALVCTNCTGTASGLTAGNVTTNANMTGPITGTGNVTSITAQTGTGTTFAMSASPTFTGTVGAAAITATGLIKSTTGSPGMQVQPANPVNAAYFQATNTGGSLYVGIDNSTGGVFGLGNYASFLVAPTAFFVQTNGTTALTLSTAQVATFASDVNLTAGSLYATGNQIRVQRTGGSGLYIYDNTGSGTSTSVRNWGIVSEQANYGDLSINQSNTLGGDPAAGTSALLFANDRSATFSAPLTASGATTTSGPFSLNVVDTVNVQPSIAFKMNNASYTNWLLGAQYHTANSFAIIPSTAHNNTTFSTPVFEVTDAGATTITGSLTVNTGALNVTAAATSQFGNSSNAHILQVYATTGGFGFVALPTNPAATSNTTHKQGPYISSRASIWNGTSAVGKDFAMSNYGVSGTNSAYYGAFESSDQSNLITARGDTKAVGIGVVPNSSYYLDVGGAMRIQGNLSITSGGFLSMGAAGFGVGFTQDSSTSTPRNNLAWNGTTRFTGSATITVNGIAAAPDGAVIYLLNLTGNAMTITDSSGSATGSPIKNPGAANKTLANLATAVLIYDATNAVWRLVSFL